MDKFVMKLTFYDMQEATVHLPKDLIRQVAQSHSKAESGVVCENDSEIFSLDLTNIMQIHATKAANSISPIIPIREPIAATPIPQPPVYKPSVPQTPAVDKIDPDEAVRQWEEKMKARQETNAFVNKELFKIECKCDTEYYANLYSDTERLRCNECGQYVYVDRFAPKKISNHGKEATLATNRYRVPFIENNN